MIKRIKDDREGRESSLAAAEEARATATNKENAAENKVLENENLEKEKLEENPKKYFDARYLNFDFH